jgi:hypothetical protein
VTGGFGLGLGVGVGFWLGFVGVLGVDDDGGTDEVDVEMGPLGIASGRGSAGASTLLLLNT